MRKAALILAFSMSAAVAAARPAVYQVREIVSPFPWDVIAHDLNDKGQVVGWFATRYYWDWNQPGKAFFYSDGVLTDIFPDDTYQTSEALGINERGQVVGRRFKDGVGVGPFLYENGATQMLNPFGYAPGAFGVAHGINESGQIVGSARTLPLTDFVGHAFVISPGATRATDIHPAELPVASYGSEALAVNDAGRAIGVYFKWGDDTNRGDTLDSFYWDGAGWRFPDDLLGLGETFTAGALNTAGQAAGTVEPRWVENIPHARAAIYDSEAGAITELAELEGAVNSRAHGINDAGVVVGEMGTSDGESRAVVWRDGVPHDLNLRLAEPLDVVLSKAFAVNGHGQIIAVGVTGVLPYHGRTRSFLLTPPAGLVGELIGSIHDLVEAGTLKAGQGQSLLVKLEQALEAIRGGDDEDDKKAVAMLEAFVHEVHAKENAGTLAGDVAADLVRKAETAISLLSH
jgi:probable HAF family extracellular repeat protein